MDNDLFNISEEKIFLFMLIFARCSGLFLSLPMFGKAAPIRIRLALSFMTALVILPLLPALPAASGQNIGDVAIALGGEIAIGFTFGFVVQLFVATVQLSGQMIGLQIGFGMASILDPQSGQQVSILAEFEVFLALLIFFSLDAHHYFIRAINYSFKVISPGTFSPKSQLLESMVGIFGQIFDLSLRIGAPVMITLILLNLALGLVARTVPQINVLVVGLPLSIGVGFLMLFLFFTYFYSFMVSIFLGLEKQVMQLMRFM